MTTLSERECRLRAQGRVDETYQMLAEIYGWFTEGFDSADLIEARALLAELSALSCYLS
jgi:hypothetical protein